jgi:hypothetical protein
MRNQLAERRISEVEKKTFSFRENTSLLDIGSEQSFLLADEIDSFMMSSPKKGSIIRRNGDQIGSIGGIN